MPNDHEWEFVACDQYRTFFNRPYTLWSKHTCKHCHTVRTILAGCPAYEPPGEQVEGFGQLEPPCAGAAV